MLQSIISGIIQGITEFLPISSSAHLIVLALVFGFDNGAADSLFFDVSLHLGTFLSVILYFHKDWAKLIKGFFSSVKSRKAETADERLIWYILFATVPAGLAGFLFEDAVEAFFHSSSDGLRALTLITVSLSLISFVMILSEKFSKQEKTTENMTLKHALIIGFAQAIALFPGVSRAGITICAGLLLGYRRDESARFSFLLGTPVIGGAFLLKFIQSAGALRTGEIGMYIVGTMTSAIVGYVAIKFLIGYLTNRKLNAFAYYRLALAFILVIYIVGLS